ncbi:MAG TPA: alkaline phosphatase family protein, partial [Mycobacteriales bacterium]|nr:alkaline phosphatase family protein [Mycobacteriales bacterium]
GAAVATNYAAVTHPSLPNYLALAAGSTFGITSDCTTCWVSATNIGDTLDAAGRTWKAYEESMPSPCFVGDSYPYAQKHDPFIYFNDIRTNTARCQANVVPYTQLATDLRSTSSTPNFAFITPNLCNDMHDCSIATGDGWLRQQVPQILASPAFTTQRSLLAITWDEDDGTESNRVATLLIGSAAATGARSSVPYNHYSLLRTVESALGAGTAGGGDASASPMNDLLLAPACAAAGASAASTATTTQFQVQLSTGGCAASAFDVSERDVTLNGAWYAMPSVAAASDAATVEVDGFAGHSYQYRVRTRSSSGATGAWASPLSVVVSSSATESHPWRGLYTLDQFGGVHPAASPPTAFG